MSDDRKDADAEREYEAQRLEEAWEAVLGNENGRAVLYNLMMSFGLTMSIGGQSRDEIMQTVGMREAAIRLMNTCEQKMPGVYRRMTTENPYV